MEKRKIILASGSPRRRELLARAGYEFEVVTSNADELSSDQVEPSELAIVNARAKALAVAGKLGKAEEPCVVIGADTIVVADGHVFGKPADEAQAAATLHALSGRAHEVITGVCLVAAGSTADRRSKKTDGEVKSAPSGNADSGSIVERPGHAENAGEHPKAPEDAAPEDVATKEQETPAETIAFAETTRVYFKRLDDAQIAAYVATGEPMDKAGAYGIQGRGAALVDHIEGDYDNVVGLPVARLARELEQP